MLVLGIGIGLVISILFMMFAIWWVNFNKGHNNEFNKKLISFWEQSCIHHEIQTKALNSIAVSLFDLREIAKKNKEVSHDNKRNDT